MHCLGYPALQSSHRPLGRCCKAKAPFAQAKGREGAEARRKIKHLLNGEWKPTAGGLSVFSFSPKAPWMSEMFLELEGVLTFSATKCSCKVFLH